MAAGLVLVASVNLGLGLADGFFVGHMGGMGCHGQVVLAAQAIEIDLQMNFPLAPKDDLVGIAMLLPAQGRIFLQQLVERRTELNLIFAVLRGNGQGINRIEGIDAGHGIRRAQGHREGIPRRHTIEAAQGNNIPGDRPLNRLGLGTHEVIQATGTQPIEQHPLRQFSLPNPHQGQFSGLGQHIGLQHLANHRGILSLSRF